MKSSKAKEKKNPCTDSGSDRRSAGKEQVHGRIKIKRNDKVEVIAGKDKGKRGRVLRVIADKDACSSSAS